MRFPILSPVFIYECVLRARRWWQTYGGRTAFLAALFISLTVVWYLRVPDHSGPLSRNALAVIGEGFFFAIVGTQLVLVLLAAPAYTAASICLDKARGTLTHMLVTDLSATEIVLGKLGARGLPVLGLILAGVPVLVLATLLGGIEPEAVAGSFLVTLGAALLSCTLALSLSVWGKKPYEVLLATYVVLANWLLTVPTWHLFRRTIGMPPDWLEIMNPFVLVFAPFSGSTGTTFIDFFYFLGVCVGLSGMLTLIAILTLRWASQREGVRRVKRRRLPRFPFQPGLDFNPVLWREWRRRVSSRWLLVIWGLYALLSLVASVIAFVSGSGGSGGEFAPFVNAFQFSIGLLLVAITSVGSFFDERVNGSLDVLLATPLPTAHIVWGKWLAGFRVVAGVALLPALLCLALLIFGGKGSPVLFVLLLGLMFGYGALVNSLGLALATWLPRFGVAVGLTVAAYALLAVGPVVLLIALGPMERDVMRGFASLSPWYGVGEITWQITSREQLENVPWKIAWLAIHVVGSLALALATLMTFDRCLGRAGGRLRLGRTRGIRREQPVQ